MAKSPKDKDEIELLPDAWERFERAVKTVVKGGPQHRTVGDKAKPSSRRRSDNKKK